MKKNWGVIYKNFWKKRESKKKMPSKLTRKFWKIRFLQKISKQIVFFYVKLEFRMFSAFIWYTYCLCRKKMADFQIFHTKSKQIFAVKLGYFVAILRQNYTIWDSFQNFYMYIKMPAFIWDPKWFIWIKNVASIRQKVFVVDSTTPTL